jgi:hypothetical protein
MTKGHRIEIESLTIFGAPVEMAKRSPNKSSIGVAQTSALALASSPSYDNASPSHDNATPQVQPNGPSSANDDNVVSNLRNVKANSSTGSINAMLPTHQQQSQPPALTLPNLHYNNHYENDDNSSVVVRSSQISPPPNAKGPQHHYPYSEDAVPSGIAANNSASKRIRKQQQQPDATSELSTAMIGRPSPAFGKRIGILKSPKPRPQIQNNVSAVVNKDNNGMSVEKLSDEGISNNDAALTKLAVKGVKGRSMESANANNVRKSRSRNKPMMKRTAPGMIEANTRRRPTRKGQNETKPY